MRLDSIRHADQACPAVLSHSNLIDRLRRDSKNEAKADKPVFPQIYPTSLFDWNWMFKIYSCVYDNGGDRPAAFIDLRLQAQLRHSPPHSARFRYIAIAYNM